jgi:microcystin-dependent protein
MFAGNFAPANWLFCEGQLLQIPDNEVLFNLIGTTYGGDGENTFALPDLRGRLPLHQGNGFNLASPGGVEEVTLTVNQMTAHAHALMASTDTGKQTTPSTNVLSATSAFDLYRVGAATLNMAPQSISMTGGSQPHSNMQPYLCVNFIISLVGIFPTPT